MSDRLGLLRVFKIIGLIWVLGVSMSASASFFGFGKESWKEEVLLHDGSKIVIERSQTRGGNHEIGQEVPIAEHKISCTLPGTHEAITWKSTYGSATNNSGLILLALDVFNGVPYIVTTTTTTTTTCSSYNKWHRPNPPYVFFKYVGKVWQRIPLAEFPAEVKVANVAINMAKHSGTLSAKEVKRINEKDEVEEVRYLRLFVREPIKNVVTACSKFE